MLKFDPDSSADAEPNQTDANKIPEVSLARDIKSVGLNRISDRARNALIQLGGNKVHQIPVSFSRSAMTGPSVWPSYGLPCSALACSTNCPPLGAVTGVAIETLQPNSYGARALPRPMHSTSGACNE